MADATPTPDNTLVLALKDVFVTLVKDPDSPDLSLRQLCVMLVCYHGQKQTDQTVRGLAEHLGVSKPAITRALDRLSELGLIVRKKDPDDLRSIFARRTTTGTRFMTSLRQTLRDALPRVKRAPAKRKAEGGEAAATT